MFQEFPKWKYHDEHEPCVVEDADQEQSLGEGWRDTPDAKVQEPVDTVESLRAALDAKGIAYDNRWGVKRLKDALEG